MVLFEASNYNYRDILKFIFKHAVKNNKALFFEDKKLASIEDARKIFSNKRIKEKDFSSYKNIQLGFTEE